MSVGIANPVRNSSGALNPAGIILRFSPAAEQRGIISNGVKVEGRAGSDKDFGAKLRSLKGVTTLGQKREIRN